MIALQSLIERAARLNPTGVATAYKGTNLTWIDTERRVASLGHLRATRLQLWRCSSY